MRVKYEFKDNVKEERDLKEDAQLENDIKCQEESQRKYGAVEGR